MQAVLCAVGSLGAVLQSALFSPSRADEHLRSVLHSSSALPKGTVEITRHEVRQQRLESTKTAEARRRGYGSSTSLQRS